MVMIIMWPEDWPHRLIGQTTNTVLLADSVLVEALPGHNNISYFSWVY